MSTFKTSFDRRSFLKVSTAAGGGMLLGFSWLASCNPTEEQKRIPPKEWFDINAYLKIGDNGQVSITSPNPEIGQNVKTSMPMIVAEELDIDWKDVIVEQGDLNTDWFKRQVAGGSQSIRQEWESLRMAGATAKNLLITAAAAKWNVDPSTCTATNGIVTNQKGESLGYGELAGEAAKLEVPEEVELKEYKDFKLIGKATGNVDLDDIITGKPLFGLDYKREGMQYAVVLRPPAFGQKLKSFDDSAAKSVNGVQSVVRFGDKVAVLANSTWAAMKGKKALTAEWEIDTKLENTVDHNTKMLELLNKKSKEPARKDGDIETAFTNADQVVERIYEAPFLPHNCMEPMNFFANVTSEKIELVGPVQTPKWTRSRVAELLKREESEITCEMTRMGGGFGRRLYGDFALEAAEISSIAKVPVKVVFSREDDMEAGTYRPASKYKIKAAIKDGQITGYQLVEAAVNSNMYGVLPNNFPAGALENYQVDNHQLESNITIGAWRAPYTNFLGFAEQSFFDEIAQIIKVDPVQLRLNLLEQAKKGVAPEGNYEPDRMIETIKLAAEKSNWGNADSGVHQGFSAYYSHNTYVAQVANVIMEDGKPKVDKVICAVDCGIVVNPLAAINLVEGGVVDGIGHAMYGDLVFENGKPTSNNFDKFRLIRINEAPKVETHFVKNEKDPSGLGEPTLPPAGGALANAIHAATGKRLYKQPFIQHSELLG